MSKVITVSILGDSRNIGWVSNRCRRCDKQLGGRIKPRRKTMGLCSSCWGHVLSYILYKPGYCYIFILEDGEEFEP